MISQISFRNPYQAANTPAKAVEAAPNGEQPPQAEAKPAAPNSPAPAAAAANGDAAKNPAPAAKQKPHGVISTIVNFPRRVVEESFGVAGGIIGSVSHTLPGTVEGISEGLSSQQSRGRGGTGWYTTILFGEAVAAGAVVGAMFTPFGAIAGGIGGAVLGLIYRGLEGHAGVPDRFCQKVEGEVDKATAANTEGSKVQIAVQNATEGAIIGTGIGFKEGFSIGRESGKGVVSGVLDVAYGVGEGIWHAIAGPHK